MGGGGEREMVVVISLVDEGPGRCMVVLPRACGFVAGMGGRYLVDAVL